MGRMQREKGKRGERAAAKALQRAGFLGRRSRQADGALDADLVVTYADGEDAGLHVEVKWHRRVVALDFLRQAVEEANGRIPIVLVRENGDPEFAVMLRLDDLRKLGAVAQEAELREIDLEELP